MSEYDDAPKKDSITIEEAKEFLQAAQKERANWLSCASNSWNEIKKQKKNGTLWSVAPNSARKSVRYPLWNSTFQIRKPLVCSRVPIPVGQDTGGTDPIGRSAAICLERLGKSIIRTFPFEEVLFASRDDALVTNVGQARAYYEYEEEEEAEKIYLQTQQDPQSGQAVYTLPDGEMVPDDVAVLQDDVGPYIETGREVSVKNEKVCLKPVLYRDFYVDACAYRWGDVYELAFAQDYSVSQFKAVFGKDAYMQVAAWEKGDGADKKPRSIRVFEYWNKLKEEIGWFTEDGDDFIAKKVMTSEGEVTQKTLSDLYELEGFFPCPKPMVFNSPTDSFWPICEWYQLNDLLEEIHTIASRIFVLSRSIRIRLLFDNNVPGLQSIINEVGEADAIGVANLSSTVQEKGGIAACVAYLPIEEMVNGLKNMYEALEQRLSKFEQLTGTGDILQGETEANTGKTLGERQMEGKFATSRLMPMQEDMQRFARDCIEMLCEMALKNFSDDSLKQYIMPETMDQDEQQNYEAAMALLKNDRKRRFRIELETDSTIAINEEYEKQMRMQLVDALTKSIEATAQVLQSTPQLAKPLIMLQQHLAEGFRQGKQFVDEINQCFDQILEAQQQAQENPQPPPPDAAMIQAQATQMNAETQRFIAETDAQREDRKAQRDDWQAQMDTQLAQMKQEIDSFKVQNDASIAAQELQAKGQQIMNDLQIALQNIQVEREKIMLAADQGNQSASIEQFKAQIDAQDKAAAQAIEQANQNIMAWKVQLDESERMRQEQRLEQEQILEARRMMMEQITKTPAPQVIPVGPSINIHQAPAQMGTVKRQMKDALGNTVTETQQMPLPSAAPAPTIL
jgi:hypothetical protein